MCVLIFLSFYLMYTCLCSDTPKLLLNVLGTHVCVLVFLSFYLRF